MWETKHQKMSRKLLSDKPVRDWIYREFSKDSDDLCILDPSYMRTCRFCFFFFYNTDSPQKSPGLSAHQPRVNKNHTPIYNTCSSPSPYYTELSIITNTERLTTHDCPIRPVRRSFRILLVLSSGHLLTCPNNISQKEFKMYMHYYNNPGQATRYGNSWSTCIARSTN